MTTKKALRHRRKGNDEKKPMASLVRGKESSSVRTRMQPHLPSLSESLPHQLVIFIVLVALYGYTAPRTVALEDDGDFCQAAYFLGVAHAPGYPLYVWLVHPFVWLPWGSVAWRVHLASGVFAATSCAVLWWITRALLVEDDKEEKKKKNMIAHVAALSFGVSRMFWSQAIIAEVYTLNLLLFLLAFAVSLMYLQSGHTQTLRFLAFFVGLALSNHWPLFGLAIPCLALVLLPRIGSILNSLLSREVVILVFFFLLGLSPYLWMFFRCRSHPQYCYIGAFESWSSFVSFVRRDMYSGVDKSPTAGWRDKVQYAGFFLCEMAQQYTFLGAALTVTGIVVHRRRWNLSFSLGILAGFLSSTFLLVAILGFDYEYLTRAAFKVYPVIPYALMALWFALGIEHFDRKLHVRYPTASQFFVAGIGLVVIPTSLTLNWKYNDRHAYDFAKDYAITLLESFEPNATVFTHGDIDFYPIAYFHTVEAVRPDIRLLNTHGSGITVDDRLPPVMSSHNIKGHINKQIREYLRSIDKKAPVYFILDTIPLEPPVEDADYGFYRKLRGLNQSITTAILDDKLQAYFQRIESYLDQTDQWTVYTREHFMQRMSRVLSMLSLNPDKSQAHKYESALELARNHFLGCLQWIRVNFVFGDLPAEQLLEWARKCEQLINEGANKPALGSLYLRKGQILLKLGHKRVALDSFEKSIEVYPHPHNAALMERQKLLG